MPQKRTSRSRAITSDNVFPAAASSSSRVGLFIVLLFTSVTAAAQIVIPGAERRALFSVSTILPAGARAEGMGGAFIAVSDDSTAPAWNPGGLAQLSRGEVSAVYDRLTINIDSPTLMLNGPGVVQTIGGTGSGDYSHIGFAAVALTSRIANVAFSYRKLSTFPEFETVLSGNRSIGGQPAQSYSSATALIPGGDVYNYGFTVAKTLFDRAHFGVSVNQLEADPTSTFTIVESEQLFVETASREFSRTYFDVGVLVTLSPRWAVGAVYHSDDETLPAQYAAGLAFRSPRLTVAADYGDGRVTAGGEFVIVVANELRLPIRAGYFIEQRESIYGDSGIDPDYDGWSAGGGMDFGRVRLDVAYVRASGRERAAAEVGEIYVPPIRGFLSVSIPGRSAEVTTARFLLSMTVQF